MQHFNELNLPESLNHTLAAMNYSEPTPIQAKAIPPAIQGRDILGSAQTGTGKTAAFGIPIAVKLLTQSRGSALVITPTRELAVQVMDQLQKLLGKRSPIKTALLIGGESMPKQTQQLRNRPRLIVGTPGRINDHLERGGLMLHEADFLVLDETDRMLDMGFTIQIEKLMKFLPKRRQTLLFSATMPKNIEAIARKYLSNPLTLSVGATSAPATQIKQDMVRIEDGEKFPELLRQLDDRSGSVIVFIKTKFGADRMATRLSKRGHSADAIHGDLRQNKRNRVIEDFRKQKIRILVATDVAARGLDIPHIEHVINYDIPQSPEDYVHRIGRTARAGATGEALSFVSSGDALKWRAVQRIVNPDAAKESSSAGGAKNRKSPSGRSRRRRSERPASTRKADRSETRHAA